MLVIVFKIINALFRALKKKKAKQSSPRRSVTSAKTIGGLTVGDGSPEPMYAFVIVVIMQCNTSKYGSC